MALGRRIHGALPYQPTQDGVRGVHGDSRSVVPTLSVVVELSNEREMRTNSSVVRGMIAMTAETPNCINDYGMRSLAPTPSQSETDV